MDAVDPTLVDQVEQTLRVHTACWESARPGCGGSATSSGPNARSWWIRAWAKDQGISVSDRGRLAASVIEQYEKAATAR